MGSKKMPKRKKTTAVKDLAVKDAKAVKGGYIVMTMENVKVGSVSTQKA